MQKFYLILFLFFAFTNLFAQEKSEYFILNGGDTVFCQIKKVNATSNNFFIKVKNTIVYKVSDEKKSLALAEMNGYKLERQAFLKKKKWFNGKDTNYYFFPTMTGNYSYAGLVIAKKKLKFYRVHNANYNGKLVYTTFFIEKNDDGNLVELPVAQGWMNRNYPETWGILKEYCKDNSYMKDRMERYIVDKERCNIDNLEDAICSYCEIALTQIPNYTDKK
jgi:hypothetical protein